MSCNFIGWCDLNSEAQAAWAHAILGFVGILVAVAVPLWLQWLTRRQIAQASHGEARSLAAALIAALVETRGMLRAFADSPALLEPGDELNAHAALKHLKIPLRLEAYSDRFHLIGAASGTLQEFYVMLVLLRADLEELELHQQYNLPNPPDGDELLGRIGQAERHATAVLRHFAAMFPNAAIFPDDSQ